MQTIRDCILLESCENFVSLISQNSSISFIFSGFSFIKILSFWLYEALSEENFIQIETGISAWNSQSFEEYLIGDLDSYVYELDEKIGLCRCILRSLLSLK
jgi:hypothetical protein